MSRVRAFALAADPRSRKFFLESRDRDRCCDYSFASLRVSGTSRLCLFQKSSEIFPQCPREGHARETFFETNPALSIPPSSGHANFHERRVNASLASSRPPPPRGIRFSLTANPGRMLIRGCQAAGENEGRESVSRSTNCARFSR